MSIGESIMRESNLRLQTLRRPPRRILPRLLQWGAWLNYLLSVIVLVAGVAAGWRFAEIGFDLMLNNVSGEEFQQKIITKIPAWIFVYKGIKLW
ncbi:MAG TPA: hypothetical protein VLT62_22995 [Candidatus Methylomirabilis sp.]|nr:hypothetical protein [Candidatus Methylomirabilis sp.]